MNETLKSHYINLMDERLRSFFGTLNCKPVNAVMDKLGGKEVVGWHCESTSNLRYNTHIKAIKTFIERNDIPYYVSDYKFGVNFMVYKKSD